MILDIALGLAKVVPSIVGWITGSDKAEKVAEKAVDMAQAVAGVDDPEAAVKAIQANPEMALKYQQAWQGFELELFREETERLKTVNETMRVEIALGQDAQNGYQFVLAMWKSGWRPFWGWVSCVVWAVFVGGIMGLLYMAINKSVAEAVSLAGALGAMASQFTTLFMMALAVLGVTVLSRSADKRAALGEQGGILSGLGKTAGKLLGGSK